MQDKRLRGMQAFTLVWAGQFISLTGSAMSIFGLTIWAYKLTGQATALALVSFFNFGPAVLFSPLAGVLVDRWNRKLMMMLSDLGAGTITLIFLLIYSSGHLQIEHVYVGAVFAGIAQSFQFPSFSAAITGMVRKEQYGQAQGMMAVAWSGSGILAPVFAAALLGLIGLGGIMFLDVVTYLFAILSLFVVYVPTPIRSEAAHRQRGSVFKEAIYGFRYILDRPGLFGLAMLFMWLSIVNSISTTLLNPMILARTASSSPLLNPLSLARAVSGEKILGSVQSVSAFGGVLGGALLTLWGGPKRKIHGVLVGAAVGALFGQVIVGLGREPWIWAVPSLIGLLCFTIADGCNQAIWMAKVAPDVQGRVFATRRMIVQIAGPLGMLIAGPLADLVFEPGLMPGGALVGTFSRVFGTGPGAGMALLIVVTGALQAVGGLAGYASRAVRRVESALPDHDSAAAGAPEVPEVEASAAV